MRNIFITVLLSLVATVAFADGHNNHEKEVLAALDKYYTARDAGDFTTVVAMESKAGTYNTNSDGSFHKVYSKSTVKGWKSNFEKGTVTKVHYAEAAALTEDVVLVRFYAEGMIMSGGKGTDYRTRVTMNWIKEDGNWVVKSSHYSPANYGGVHQTLASDFED